MSTKENISRVQRRAWTVTKRVLPLTYFLAVSLPHHPFSNFFDKNILIPAGFFPVQHATNLVSIAMLIGLALMGVRVVRVHASRSLRHFSFSLLHRRRVSSMSFSNT